MNKGNNRSVVCQASHIRRCRTVSFCVSYVKPSILGGVAPESTRDKSCTRVRYRLKPYNSAGTCKGCKLMKPVLQNYTYRNSKKCQIKRRSIESLNPVIVPKRSLFSHVGRRLRCFKLLAMMQG